MKTEVTLTKEEIHTALGEYVSRRGYKPTRTTIHITRNYKVSHAVVDAEAGSPFSATLQSHSDPYGY